MVVARINEFFFYLMAWGSVINKVVLLINSMNKNRLNFRFFFNDTFWLDNE